MQLWQSFLKLPRLAQLLIVLAIVVLAAKVTGNLEPTKRSATPPARSGPRCQLAGGNISPGAKLHLDSSCSEAYAEVVSIGDGKVQIRFTSGEVEWKDRGAIARETYVMAN
jgi:hypothetical protein